MESEACHSTQRLTLDPVWIGTWKKANIFTLFFHWIPGPAPRPVMKCFLSPMNHQFLLSGAGFAVLVVLQLLQVGSKLHHSGGGVCVVQCRVWCGLS